MITRAITWATVAGGAGGTGAARRTRATRRTSAAWPVATWSAIGALAAVGAWSAVAAFALGKGLGDRFEWFLAWNERKQAGLLGLLLGGRDGEDRDAVKLEFGVGLHHHSGSGVARQNRSVEHTLWLLCASGAPGPHAVGARAREFDLNPAGHGPQRYPLNGSSQLSNCF